MIKFILVLDPLLLPSSAQAQLEAELVLILKYLAAAHLPGRPEIVPEKLPKKLILSIQASYNPTSNKNHI
jgi:hypothetical protein